MFIPANFQLIELDDAALSGQENTARRFCWQGHVGEPAEEVCLAWDGGGHRQAAVSTALLARHPGRWDRRFNAMFVLLGGDKFDVDSIAAAPAAKHAMMADYAERDDVWTPREIRVDGGLVQAETAQVRHALVGHFTVGDRSVCLATVGLDVADIRLRTLDAPSAARYRADPTTRLDDATLNAQMY